MELLHEIPGCEMRITNFSIEEILKPDFGRRQLTTGILNLTVDRKTHEVVQNGQQFRHSQCTQNSKHTPKSGFTLSVSKAPNLHVPSFNHVSPSELGFNRDSGGESSPPCSPASSTTTSPGSPPQDANSKLWPAWVYCTRYSDRPSAGPRSRKSKRHEKTSDDKRPRTAFSTEQLRRLKQEFDNSRYLTESRRQHLARELGLNESQIKIWFQNKRAKNKKNSGQQNMLAMELMAQGLYNHKTGHGDDMDVKMEV